MPSLRILSAACLSATALIAAAAGWTVHAHAGQAHVTADQGISQFGSPNWASLSASQKQVLQPLAGQWNAMDSGGKEKWLEIAQRYNQLSPAEQQRLRERMMQWADLPAEERGEARLRFQQSRQLSPTERQQKWEAYLALPEADRNDLAKQAQRKAKPVFLADKMVGPREQAQLQSWKRTQAGYASAQKNNSPILPGRTVVSPTTVKASTGATTSLVTQSPTPPLHQQAGLPKISATKAFVDPVTLLPRKGAQGAAMASAPIRHISDDWND